MGKLSGIKVVDLTQFLPGPMLSLMMADQGASVIKVEPAAGDPARSQAPFENGQSVWFSNLNRGKTSIVLDLKNEAGKNALRDLIRTADVFLEGFRPGVMARLGFGWEEARALNPRLVYCSISAFGQSGSLAHHPAHDMAVQALAGFISVNDAGDGSRPVVPGVPAADVAAGLTGLAAVLMALIGREKSGQGDYLDIAMFDSLLPWSAHIAGGALAGGTAPLSAAQRSLGGAAFYNVYACADDRYVVLGGRELKFATALLTALGRPDLIVLAEADAGPAQAPLINFFRETFRTRSRDAWDAFMRTIDVAYAPVLDFAEAYAQPHIAERGLIVEADGRHHIAPAIRFAGEEWLPGPVPELGEG
jgi:crotonobetainyl-CoA:carnitine CoA-transferase CaiB-like acyl-CoA transferase